MFSLISKLFNDLPSNFGYTVGEKVEGEDYSIWTHYRGFRKNRPEQSCSIFVFNKSHNSNSGFLGFLPVDVARKIAKNQFQKCKSLIHPSILKVYDTIEVPNSYYIITEPCVSLYNLAVNSSFTFGNYSSDSNEFDYDIQFPIDCISGLYDVTSGVKFLHDDAKLLHGNISPFNIYVNYEGSWKLGGFENSILISDTNSSYIDDISRQSTSYNIMGWKFSTFSSRNPKNVDLWNLGCLIYWSYNVSSKLDSTLNINDKLGNQVSHFERKKIVDSLKLPYSNEILTFEGDLIPHWLYDWLSDLLTCLDTNKEVSIENGLILMINNSPFVEFMNQINHFILKSPDDKKDFCIRYLPNLITSIKVHCIYTTNLIIIQRILDKILVNFSQCTPTVFPLVLTLMDSYSFSNCPKFILNSFQNTLKFLLNLNDRSVRYTLLSNISKYERFLTKDIFHSCIDSILMGFQDTANLIREATLQSMIFIIPLLLKDREPSIASESCQNSRNNTKITGSNDLMYSIKEGLKNSAAIFNALGSSNNSRVAVDRLVCSMFNLSKDPEVIIRSNTVICFAKLMNILPEQYYQTILNKIYIQILKDPFPICRKAVIQAFLSTINFYPPLVITQQILPNVSIYGFIEGQPDIMEISILLIKNITKVLTQYIQEQTKLKEEQEKTKEKQIQLPNSVYGNSTTFPLQENIVHSKSVSDYKGTTNVSNHPGNIPNIQFNASKTLNVGNITDLKSDSGEAKSDINWNDFESDIFDLNISKNNTPRNFDHDVKTIQVKNQSLMINNTNNCLFQKSDTDLFNSSSSLKIETNSNLKFVGKKTEETPLNVNNTSNSKISDCKSREKKTLKLDLNSDDFWKEFE